MIEHIQKQINTSTDGVWGEKSKQALGAALQNGQIIKITEHISLNELLKSQTAMRRRIDNTPDDRILQNLMDAAINLWQPVRDILGVPMIVSSGYRSPTLNRAVGGSVTSAHSHGLAIDFSAPKFGNTRTIAKKLATELKARGIKFDQLILEFPDGASSWIHLGYKSPNGKQRGQLLTAVKRGGRTVYLSGLH